MKLSDKFAQANRLSFLAKMGIIFASVVLPRIAVLGSLPSTDEGVYAFLAQLAHTTLASGQGLPDGGPLMLYPILVSWTYDFSVNHLIFLRIVDMFCAVAASWILYQVIEAESRSRVAAAFISFIFLFTMNHPTFIQSGFKNSFFAAYIPLFLTLRLAQTADIQNKSSWFAIGGLVGLSVLLRETFVPFAVVGVVSILISRGWRTSLQFCLGGLIVGISIVSIMLYSRGGMLSLIASYREAGLIYKSMQSQSTPLFFSSGKTAVKEMQVALCLSVLSIAAILVSPSRLKNCGRTWFWIAVTLVPLLEPLSKIGFPYHFSVCLVGMAGLSAVAWRTLTINDSRRTKARVATIVLGLLALSLLPKFVPLEGSWRATSINVQHWDTNDWIAESVSQSNYLLAADAIKKNALPNSTLSVSGFMFALYPLTDLLPPTYELSQLSTLVIKPGFDKDRIRDALRLCPPDIVMTSSRTDWPGGADIISAAVEESRLYREVAVIPVAKEKSYGNFGGTIYKRVNSDATTCDKSASTTLAD